MILQTVKDFIQKRAGACQPLLLGFSGGPDSLALLHALLAIVKDFPLHVAHVDHGWRKESEEEALMLKRYVTDFGIPFHLKRLTECKGEEQARHERLSFFSTLYKDWGCKALILGHHADDQSETVLKRILEGAHLTSLGGILEESCLYGMTIWRPLLKHRKKEIYAFLEKENLTPLQDPTNQDSKFLRSRMRKEILPWLSEKFGKEVADNLCKIGLSTQELKSYLDKKIEPYYKLLEKKDGEIKIDFTSLAPFEPVEIKTFLKKLSDEEDLGLSAQSLNTLYDLIERGAFKKKIIGRKKIIEIHRRVVAIKNAPGY